MLTIKKTGQTVTNKEINHCDLDSVSERRYTVFRVDTEDKKFIEFVFTYRNFVLINTNIEEIKGQSLSVILDNDKDSYSFILFTDKGYIRINNEKVSCINSKEARNYSTPIRTLHDQNEDPCFYDTLNNKFLNLGLEEIVDEVTRSFIEMDFKEDSINIDYFVKTDSKVCGVYGALLRNEIEDISLTHKDGYKSLSCYFSNDHLMFDISDFDQGSFMTFKDIEELKTMFTSVEKSKELVVNQLVKVDDQFYTIHV